MSTDPNPMCTPDCDALQADRSRTGLARGWHSDDCPVPVHHHVTDGSTACGVLVTDLPPAHGYTSSDDRWGGDWDTVDCKGCGVAYQRHYLGLEEPAEHGCQAEGGDR